MKPITILVTGAGGAPSTNFIRSLRKARKPFKIIGTDADPYYFFRSEADKTYLVPPVSDPSYIPILNNLIKKHSVSLVHIQNDYEIEYMSAHREELNAPLFLPSTETVEVCQDKYKSYKAWESTGLTVPKTYTIDSEQDLKNAFTQAGPKLWIRSTKGAAGKWSLPVDSFAIAKAWIDAHDGWGTFLAATRLEEGSITWMSLWYNGKLLLAQGRKRLYWEMGKVSPSGVTGVTGGGETVRDPELDSIAKKAIYAIDSHPHGLFGVDLTFDTNGVPNPTEINIGRFFTTHQFFTEAGLNMPYFFVMYGLGKEIPLPKRKINPIPSGKVWIRGVDFLPILTTRKKITQEEKKLEKMKNIIKA